MNRKLKIALKRRSSEQGFAIPVAVGMGLIMVLVGTTMILRSQDDQVTASAQKATNQGLSAAETGITRYQSLVNKNRAIAMYSRTGSLSWENAASIPGINSTCASSSGASDVTAAATTGWRNVVAADPTQGQYRLVDYTYPTPGVPGSNGTLTVEGQVNQNITVGIATTRLRVDIPVQQPTPPAFSGVWVGGVATAPAPVNAHIMGPCNSSSITTPISAGYEPATHTPLTIPTLQPATPPASAINLGSSIPAILPRATDTPNANGVYEYRISSISENNVDRIITPGAKVTWYLTGNIDLGGNSYIQHTCPAGGTICKSSDFKILGYATNGTIEVSGNSCLGSAFIFAPTYTVSVNGGGNAHGCAGNYLGAAWVRNWTGNGGGSHVGLQQQITDWNDTGIPLSSLNLPPTLAPSSSWQRLEVTP